MSVQPKAVASSGSQVGTRLPARTSPGLCPAPPAPHGKQGSPFQLAVSPTCPFLLPPGPARTCSPQPVTSTWPRGSARTEPRPTPLPSLQPLMAPVTLPAGPATASANPLSSTGSARLPSLLPLPAELSLASPEGPGHGHLCGAPSAPGGSHMELWSVSLTSLVSLGSGSEGCPGDPSSPPCGKVAAWPGIQPPRAYRREAKLLQ